MTKPFVYETDSLEEFKKELEERARKMFEVTSNLPFVFLKDSSEENYYAEIPVFSFSNSTKYLTPESIQFEKERTLVSYVLCVLRGIRKKHSFKEYVWKERKRGERLGIGYRLSQEDEGLDISLCSINKAQFAT
jgi:hypothetical protein